MFVLKFKDSECWIAPWSGDPGRTLIREGAKQFKTVAKALRASKKIKQDNRHRKFELVVEPY